MGSNKKDLKIVYNLEWKNNGAPHNGGSNVVGMYDIPATTLNWETFKSYLLKNSGAGVDDVKVSYVSTDDKEFPIESQLDFQIALYSFRQRAFNNDVITLKLEPIGDNKMVRVKRQRQHVEEGVTTPQPAEDIPLWFKSYMKEYKKEIIEEVTTSVVNAMSNVKLQALGRKLKETSTKRLRKSGENNEKEIRKALKLERKIEELEEKTNKIKEKKLALSCTKGAINQPSTLPVNDSKILMDATPVGPAKVIVANITVGEIHRQEWIVINTGTITWTAETELRYAWGSEALKPIEDTISCPLLKPGEKGSIVIFLEVPSTSGEYECYWHFCHNGRRFGHWLGLQVTVEESPIKILSAHRFDPVDKSITVEPPSAVSWSSQIEKSSKESEESVVAVASALDDLILVCSDSDNQSIVSIGDSQSSVNTTRSDEFVVVPIDSESEGVAETVEKDKKSGYAYIHFKGEKHAVPKVLLRSDYLQTAEEANTPSFNTDNDKRLFVFPLNCPGFEVLNSQNSESEAVRNQTTSDQPMVNTQAQPIKVEYEEVASSDTQNSEKQSINTPNASMYSINNPLPIFSPRFNIPPPVINIAPTPINIRPSPMNIPPPPMNLPPPPMNLPLPQMNLPIIPPSCSVPLQSSLLSPNMPHYFPHTSCPQFRSNFVPPANSPYQYFANDPFGQLYLHTNADSFYPHSQTAPLFEGEEAPINLNGSAAPASASAHIIPDTLVSGAVNAASSAINTARSVLNLFSSTPVSQVPPQPTTESSESSLRRKKLMATLREMGFWDNDLNNVLLERFHDDIGRVVTELLK